MAGDPYKVLGVSPQASTEELHDAYRRLVKLHHPDRNGGSAQATREFQEIQAAYEQVQELRAAGGGTRSAPRRDDASVESRMADLERELREANAVRERARQAARDAADEMSGRPSDGRVTTDDSFAKILADVRTELSGRLAGAQGHPAVRRVANLIDGLDSISSRFDRH
ncbi:MAG: hypothetical protein NVSMB25_02090 [Thermoleophilaceae bacterium]